MCGLAKVTKEEIALPELVFLQGATKGDNQECENTSSVYPAKAHYCALLVGAYYHLIVD